MNGVTTELLRSHYEVTTESLGRKCGRNLEEIRGDLRFEIEFIGKFIIDYQCVRGMTDIRGLNYEI